MCWFLADKHPSLFCSVTNTAEQFCHIFVVINLKTRRFEKELGYYYNFLLAQKMVRGLPAHFSQARKGKRRADIFVLNLPDQSLFKACLSSFPRRLTSTLSVLTNPWNSTRSKYSWEQDLITAADPFYTELFTGCTLLLPVEYIREAGVIICLHASNEL